MYTFEQLKDDVRKEAEALKIHATKEERGSLSNELLNPYSHDRCIYGLMCGDCYSDRAEFLKITCAKKFVSDTNISAAKVIEGQGMIYYSPIESYIQQPEARNANLIAFLRGETETLTL
jgi:hypothetical protein